MASQVSTGTVLSALDNQSCVIDPHLLFCTSALGCGSVSHGKPFLAGGREGTCLKRIPVLPSLNIYFSAVTSRAS